MCDFRFGFQNGIFVLKDKVVDVGEIQGNGNVEVGQGGRNLSYIFKNYVVWGTYIKGQENGYYGKEGRNYLKQLHFFLFDFLTLG